MGVTAEPAPSSPPPPAPAGRRRARWKVAAAAAGGVVVVAGIAVGASALVWSRGGLRRDGEALAGLDVPPGDTVTGARAIAPDGTVTALEVRGGGLWPVTPLPSGQELRVEATVHRPSAVAWLVGDTARVTTSLRTPSARVSRRWLTLPAGAPVTVGFDQPVSRVVVTAAGTAAPASRAPSHGGRGVTLPRTAPAGSLSVAAVTRRWEKPAPATQVSWFPAGARPVAVVHPARGQRLGPREPIRLTLSRPVADVLGRARPAVSPAVPGRWTAPDSHTLMFTPTGLGFPLGATVRVTLPPALDVAASASRVVAMRVPGGTEARLQQLLAQLGYLPLRFRPDAPVARRPEAQLAAAMAAPAGRFTWRWDGVPSGLRALWTPGRDGVMTRGALMAFQRDHGLTTDGLAGGSTWHALLAAAVGGHRITPDYTYVMVSRDGQSMSLWNDGRVVLRTPVNTGIPEAPTAPGTYAVFEHLRSTTMSGTNPDGSHYNDPGVPWVSYFNGGDALHGFPRGTYGVAQSLGCVELPIGTAAKVWPYTPVGTLVTVA